MANVLVPMAMVQRVSYSHNVGVLGPFGGVGDTMPLLNPTKAITGFVLDRNNVGVVGATVLLIRQSDAALVAKTISGMSGAYVFPRDSRDTATYFTIAYSVASGSTQVHGTSDRGLVPS